MLQQCLAAHVPFMPSEFSEECCTICSITGTWVLGLGSSVVGADEVMLSFDMSKLKTCDCSRLLKALCLAGIRPHYLLQNTDRPQNRHQQMCGPAAL